MRADPYLNFKGQCGEAFSLYERVLGGTIVGKMSFAESPMADQIPAEQRDWLIHARLVAGDVVLMGSDAPPDKYRAAAGTYISLQVETPSEADRIFGALAEGGRVEMPIQETFWARRFGSCADRFGILWMVNCDKPM